MKTLLLTLATLLTSYTFSQDKYSYSKICVYDETIKDFVDCYERYNPMVMDISNGIVTILNGGEVVKFKIKDSEYKENKVFLYIDDTLVIILGDGYVVLLYVDQETDEYKLINYHN